MTVERTLIEHYAPSSDFARVLQGRYVTEIDDEFDTITLDDGTILQVEGTKDADGAGQAGTTSSTSTSRATATRAS